MIVNNVFDIGDVVYLKCDPEQKMRMVTAILVDAGALTYRINCGPDEYYAYDFEINKSPNQGLSLGLNGFINN